MQHRRLHNSNGPAIRYSDGFCVYALNGVRFSSGYFIDTPPDQLNRGEVLAIGNVEQRSEVIKRIGIEKFLSDLDSRVLDRQGDMYRLLSVSLPAYDPRIYLEMRNPSVGDTHIEAVHPDCRTVQQALAWRNFGKIDIPFHTPEVLT